MNDKVSVIVPLYNAEDVIIRAIKSLLNQTIDIDEVIVVDDGSTDSSVRVVEDFLITNNINNIKIRSKKNGGAASARNYGIRLANNEIIGFLDSDDEWVSDKLEQQLPIISQKNVCLVGGNHFPSRIRRIGLHRAEEINSISLGDLLYKNYFQTSTVITKKSLVQKFGGFDESQRYAEEGKFYYNISQFGEMIHLNTQLVIYDGGDKCGFGESGLSANIKEMEKGELSNIKFAYEYLGVGKRYYFSAVTFSLLKYLRRMLIKKLG